MATLTERDSSTVAKVQDLSDEFVNAKSFKFPFMSRTRKGKPPENAKCTYAVEKYADPVITGAVDEADVTTFNNPRAGDAELDTRIHTLEQGFRIGGLATTVTHQAGVTPKNVVTKAVAKALVELKRNGEIVNLGDGESRVDDGVRGNETRGLIKWAQATAQTHYPVPSAFLTPSSSLSTTAIADYNDTTITDIAKSQYDEHGDATTSNVLYAGSTWKQNLDRVTIYSRDVTNRTAVRHFNQEVSDTVSMGTVDFLKTSFGTYEVVLSQHINASGDPTSAASKRLAVATPEEYVELRFAEQPTMFKLAKTGRGEKFAVTMTWVLAHLNPRVLAKWTPSA